MEQVDPAVAAPGADVCLVLEGTYPYVRGGVSKWVHDLIGDLPDVRFTLVHIGPERGACGRRLYTLPANVTALSDLYCREPRGPGGDEAARRRAVAAGRRHADARRPSRVLRGIRRLHLEDGADAALLEDLASGDLSVEELLHGRAAFELTEELCERLAPDGSFVDVFWHLRSMHLPLVRLLCAEPPAAATYHAVCTGYAGLLAAVWSRRTGRPFLLTEHGIYVRERSLELDRWFLRPDAGRRAAGAREPMDGATASTLRGIWAHFFRALARCAYARATAVVTLCEGNRRRQIADGAAARKTLVVPNGIDLARLRARVPASPPRPAGRGPVRVGFVGRVVPIKDVLTFIRAGFLALRTVDADIRIIGPLDEDPAYTRRCRRLVAELGLEGRLRFEGPQPIERVYSGLDVVVLTSISEAQPLVILEANAAGLPVIASDVGACRELLEGRSDADREIGPSGIVTRLAAPEETAAAIVRLARDPELRRRLGAAGQRRVAAFYQRSATAAAYRALYAARSWPASAGDSSAC
ncbi:MAG TPA: GT4 family glycosyltransferase PelF [Candidatus Eisenbacteria bacterium]|nr:GT4 family glycosyltransferase PelF [Candidatus Eisenbacteria bacterium]